MKTLAIIAEYNPFHNGHLYHLNKAKEITEASHTVALISGNFLQRGIPAMWNKYTRGRMCTSSGIDLALELPFPYATGSAKDFATGAINILDKLNSIDFLCFGAECDDINLLTKIADVINQEPDSYKEQLTTGLASGLSYPKARTMALNEYFISENINITDIINKPNNILAMEYIAALRRIRSRIKPIIIKRHNAMYHDNVLYGSISSASAIRTQIESTEFNINNIKHDIPEQVNNIIANDYMVNWPITCDDLTPFLQSKLLNPINFNEVCDISEDLANKLYKLHPVTNYQDTLNALSSKDLTTTRICRSLIHLIMNYKEADRSKFIANDYAFYANILAFKKDSSSLIKTINQASSIPLITKKADFESYIGKYPDVNKDAATTMWNYDMNATLLYNCLVYNHHKTILPNDYNTEIPII